MIVKVHKSQDNRIIVAVCDSELLGKRFEDGNLQLDMTSNFFNGDEKEDSIAGDLIRNADSVNLVGEKSVNLGVQEGVIEKQHVKKIVGIPYTQAMIMHG